MFCPFLLEWVLTAHHSPLPQWLYRQCKHIKSTKQTFPFIDSIIAKFPIMGKENRIRSISISSKQGHILGSGFLEEVVTTPSSSSSCCWNTSSCAPPIARSLLHSLVFRRLLFQFPILWINNDPFIGVMMPSPPLLVLVERGLLPNTKPMLLKLVAVRC